MTRHLERRRFLRYLAGSPALLGGAACYDPDAPPAHAEGEQESAERFGFNRFPRALIEAPDEAADVFDFRALAERNLPPAHYGYIATGVDGEGTLAANRAAFERVGIRARRLVDVSEPDLSVTLFDRRWTSPIGIAPCGSQKAFHAGGEVAVALAARSEDHLQPLSTVTTSSVEEVNEARGEPVWYQLYPTTSFEVTKQLVARAEAAGCPALVLTVDLPAGSNRITQALSARLDQRECTICHQPGFANYVSRKSMFDEIEVADAVGRSRFAGLNQPAMTWEVIRRLRDITDMRLLLKGIVTAEDAELCIEHGVDAIVVSNHGGRAEDAFHVVVPSLPGYGFSERPRRPGHSRTRTARMFMEVMARLGYGRYGVQAGDIGASVALQMALADRDRMSGLHLNLCSGDPPDPDDPEAGLSPDEIERLRGRRAYFGEDERGYALIQGTRPQTLGYGLNDSPVGLAAWIVEKYRTWCDCDGHPETIFTKDELLTTVMIYWVTETATSAARYYYEGRHIPEPPYAPVERRVEVPTGCAVFPHELGFTPRSWAERRFDVRRFTYMERGGHFAALEQPELLAGELRAFFRDLR